MYVFSSSARCTYLSCCHRKFRVASFNEVIEYIESNMVYGKLTQNVALFKHHLLCYNQNNVLFYVSIKHYEYLKDVEWKSFLDNNTL